MDFVAVLDQVVALLRQRGQRRSGVVPVTREHDPSGLCPLHGAADTFRGGAHVRDRALDRLGGIAERGGDNFDSPVVTVKSGFG